MRGKGNGTFLGMANVPADPPGTIREDSPRHRHVRSLPEEARADRVLDQLSAADIDAPIALVDPFTGNATGETMTKRQQLEIELDAQAHEIRPRPYRTGRRLNLISEGEGIVDEYADDSDIATPHANRIGSAAFAIGKVTP